MLKPSSTNNESTWIADAQEGDQKAFHCLYEKHHRRIYALCLRMVADKHHAEDVCQEVFVQLWHKIKLFNGESKFSTWFYRLATNIILMHIRQQKTWLQRFLNQETTVNQAQISFMPELSDLDKYILLLPERARLVFILFAVEGYQHEEIAQMLNMAVGTSKAQYHRARKLLQVALGEA